MAENLFCDEINCRQAAHAFGFVRGLKQKTCEEHAQTLMDKEVSLYNIAAFIFMHSPEDAPIYERRREYVHRGISALTALETV